MKTSLQFFKILYFFEGLPTLQKMFDSSLLTHLHISVETAERSNLNQFHLLVWLQLPEILPLPYFIFSQVWFMKSLFFSLDDAYISHIHKISSKGSNLSCKICPAMPQACSGLQHVGLHHLPTQRWWDAFLCGLSLNDCRRLPRNDNM